jgi:carbon-monoxide dehydrogenase medium subunit
MKAAPFAYARPASLPDAVAELAGADGGAKVLAGGQSLVPVMAMRLARPGTLVDITGIDSLSSVERAGDAVEIGAAVRQRGVERDPVAGAVPLLGMALPWVGHRELRSRGTVCGSLAHADPAAELPAVACCLDGQIGLDGPDGRREVSAREFFTGAMTTDLRPDEVLTSVRLPGAAGEGFGFGEIARRHGDFALAGVAVRVGERAVLTAFGVSDRPVTRDVTADLDACTRAPDVERALREPMAALAGDVVDTEGDAHGSRDYRRRLFAVLASRELARAHNHSQR